MSNPIKIVTEIVGEKLGKIVPLAVKRPARKRSESPGRKKPIKSPVSAKIIAKSTITAEEPAQVKITSGFMNFKKSDSNNISIANKKRIKKKSKVTQKLGLRK